MHTAVVWTWNSDLQTGNFVPPGETASGKVSDNNLWVLVAKMPSKTYSYCVQQAEETEFLMPDIIRG